MKKKVIMFCLVSAMMLIATGCRNKHTVENETARDSAPAENIYHYEGTTEDVDNTVIEEDKTTEEVITEEDKPTEEVIKEEDKITEDLSDEESAEESVDENPVSEEKDEDETETENEELIYDIPEPDFPYTPDECPHEHAGYNYTKDNEMVWYCSDCGTLINVNEE